MLYKARNRFFDDYSLMVSEAKFKATHGKGIKIFTSKKMLQRLQIVISQVKVGNTFENLLNEIHLMIYFFHQAKEITKKVYNNNIMNSKKV